VRSAARSAARSIARVALRVVIFGPGAVGTAFGQRLMRRGVDVLGFVGRDVVRTMRALRWVAPEGVRGLQPFHHVHAHVVLFAVGDDELRAAVRGAAAAAPPRPCSLWVHTSGRHGLDVFDGVPGIRRGALHPVAPFPDGPRGRDAMQGAPAVITGDANALRLLRGLCRRLDLVPVAGADGDRVAYHAACALAANGLTALFAAAVDTFVASRVVEPADARRLTAALMRAAVAGCEERPAHEALSGPVRRGDAVTVAAHVAALRGAEPALLPLYVASSRAALRLAIAAGLPVDRAAAVTAALDAAGPAAH
jgi:predicted short-subunit dehydrogenase-like oxidoreductase (DUF2520 family)